MGEKKSQKNAELARLGDWVRGVRETLGLDRDEFAARLGLSPVTVRNVELGRQALGRAAMLRVHELARQGVAESPVEYDARPDWARLADTPAGMRLIEEAVAFLYSEDAQEKIRKIAEIMECPEQEAAAMFVMRKLRGAREAKYNGG